MFSPFLDCNRLAGHAEPTPAYPPHARFRRFLPMLFMLIVAVGFPAGAQEQPAGGSYPGSENVDTSGDYARPDTLDLSRWTGDMPDYFGRVVHLRDGDTFEIDFYTEKEMGVRLKGINTPETGGRGEEEFWGDEASAATARRLVPGTVVRLDFAGDITGNFGRLLAYVWYWNGSEWRFLNRELLEGGHAVVENEYRFELPLEFLGYQEAARRAGRGMWSDPGRIRLDTVHTIEEWARRRTWIREWLAER
jgi:micrococcal nuclease